MQQPSLLLRLVHHDGGSIRLFLTVFFLPNKVDIMRLISAPFHRLSRVEVINFQSDLDGGCDNGPASSGN